MKIVKVTYTTKAGFAQQNQTNIQNVMADLQKLNSPGLFYHACLGPDGLSFTHTAFFSNEETEKVLLGLPAFQVFQQQLKANGLDSPPRQELLSLVGASKEIF
jgi:hypothetical protein